MTPEGAGKQTEFDFQRDVTHEGAGKKNELKIERLDLSKNMTSVQHSFSQYL